eukprot:353669-Chlamydomonas_euryale.AAC.1
MCECKHKQQLCARALHCNGTFKHMCVPIQAAHSSACLSAHVYEENIPADGAWGPHLAVVEVGYERADPV